MKKDLLLETFGDFSITKQNLNQTKGGQGQEITLKYYSSTCACFMVISDTGTKYYTAAGTQILANSPDNDIVYYT